MKMGQHPVALAEGLDVHESSDPLESTNGYCSSMDRRSLDIPRLE